MTSAKELRRIIEDVELEHLAFKHLFDFMRRRIDDALEGFAPRIEWVVGPSRVGKTMLSKALARLYPESKLDGRRHVPFLPVFLPPSVSPVLLPISVLGALGMPLPTRGQTSGLMFNRMADQLRLAGTRFILFEEASHLVEIGARVPPRAAADWFKCLSDGGDLTLALTGVPRLERLFDSNEQLRLRASARKEFLPYDYRSQEERLAFAACVRTYADLFRDAGWPIELHIDVLVPHCYLLTGGLVGILSRFMQELASQVANEKPRSLSWNDCGAAASAIAAAGHPDFPAFKKEEVSAAELGAAHAYVLETNGMKVRRVVTPTGGLA